MLSDGLNAFFTPKSVAVVGASREPEKIGHIIYKRLKLNRQRGLLRSDVHPVNPFQDEIDGDKVYKSITEIEDDVDLVVVAIPAAAVPKVIREAAESGVKAAVIVSGGFAETGNDNLQQELRRIVENSNLRIMGPNTVGIIDLYSGVDTFFIKEFKRSSNGATYRNIVYPRQGNISLVSQSGALATYFVDSLAERNGGLSAVACVGNQIDVKTEELVSYFAEDDRTSVLAVYVEGLSEGRRFLNGILKARRRGKTVVVLKAGRGRSSARAAYTHTASLVGEYDTFLGAVRQSGAIAVESVRELVDVSYAASMQKLPKGSRLLVLTNAGGFSVMASDLTEINGLELPTLPEQNVAKLVEYRQAGAIPSIVVPNNPLDLSGSATPEAFEKAYQAVAEIGDVHVLMPFNTPPGMDETVIEKLAKIAKTTDKTILACNVGSAEYAVLFRRLIAEKGIPVFRDLEDVLRVAGLLAKHYTPVRNEFQEITPAADKTSKPVERAAVVKLLREHGIDTVKERIVYSVDEAIDAAREIGFSVVMKLASEKISHKTDIGGVILNVSKEEEVVRSFERLQAVAAKAGVLTDGVAVQKTEHGLEMILGAKHDAVFGPVVTVGFGGIFAELLKSYVVMVAPVNEEEAKYMLQNLEHSELFKGFRNLPAVDVESLAKTVASFSTIIAEDPAIHQIEINPLMVSGSQSTAVDFRALRIAVHA
ncbi:MAG: acetate--CoA ligase family protein [Candidatus Caldarchaeum sp.]